MAAKLQCEICGGKLIGKPGGIFECESCGTEYSTAWAKEKIQEIQGTVKVEGIVEVKGSVQVEGTANVQSLIKRGNLALEDRKWEEAENCFDDALNADPENAEAYLGLVMTKRKVCDKEAFALAYIDKRIEADDNNIKRAKQFADNKLKAWFNDLDKKKQSNLGLLQFLEQTPKYRISISAGWEHTVGLRSDGTVLAVGNNKYGQCDVECWTDIVAIAAGYNHTLGLKADGTVVATGLNDNGQCNVQGWTDIVHISAGQNYTVGLKKTDGSVVAVGVNDRGQCDVQSWNDIVAISVGSEHTVGLKSDGTVVAVGDDDFDQCDVSAWTDIVAISAGNMHTVGLKADGTVVAVGNDLHGQCNVTYWKGIAAVVAGSFNTIGLKEDGSVIATKVTGDIDYQGQCDVQGWKDVLSVSTKGGFAVGLKSNNTVIAIGDNDFGQCNVASWKLFKSEEEKEKDYSDAVKLQNSTKEADLKKAYLLFASMKDYQDSKERAALCKKAYEEKKATREERERAENAEREKAEREAREARERAERAAAQEAERKKREAERQSKIAALNTEKSTLQTELANLKGLFTGKRRKQIEARLAQIENELKSLK